MLKRFAAVRGSADPRLQLLGKARFYFAAPDQNCEPFHIHRGRDRSGGRRRRSRSRVTRERRRMAPRADELPSDMNRERHAAYAVFGLLRAGDAVGRTYGGERRVQKTA